MSIQAELTRITNAKSAIKTAIEGKGVTVPDGTLLDGMAALIESIEAGGGGGGFENIKTATGSFTPASLTSCPHQTYATNDAFTIEHNAGFVPRAVIAYTGKFATSNLTLYAAVVKGLYQYGYMVSASAVYQYYSNKKFINNSIIQASHVLTWNDSVFVIGLNGDTIQLAAGTAINWVVFS